MSSKEPAVYLSGSVGFEVSAKFLRDLRYVSRGPVLEKRGSLLVYRKSTSIASLPALPSLHARLDFSCEADLPLGFQGKASWPAAQQRSQPASQ